MPGGKTTRAQARIAAATAPTTTTPPSAPPPATCDPRKSSAKSKAAEAPQPRSLPHLPDEIWTNILKHVLRPRPVIGDPTAKSCYGDLQGTYKWADLHQGGLAAMMRVSVRFNRLVAPILYAEPIVDDLYSFAYGSTLTTKDVRPTARVTKAECLKYVQTLFVEQPDFHEPRIRLTRPSPGARIPDRYHDTLLAAKMRTQAKERSIDLPSGETRQVVGGKTYDPTCGGNDHALAILWACEMLHQSQVWKRRATYTPNQAVVFSAFRKSVAAVVCFQDLDDFAKIVRPIHLVASAYVRLVNVIGPRNMCHRDPLVFYGREVEFVINSTQYTHHLPDYLFVTCYSWPLPGYDPPLPPISIVPRAINSIRFLPFETDLLDPPDGEKGQRSTVRGLLLSALDEHRQTKGTTVDIVPWLPQDIYYDDEYYDVKWPPFTSNGNGGAHVVDSSTNSDVYEPDSADGALSEKSMDKLWRAWKTWAQALSTPHRALARVDSALQVTVTPPNQATPCSACGTTEGPDCEGDTKEHVLAYRRMMKALGGEEV